MWHLSILHNENNYTSYKNGNTQMHNDDIQGVFMSHERKEKEDIKEK